MKVTNRTRPLSTSIVKSMQLKPLQNRREPRRMASVRLCMSCPELPSLTRRKFYAPPRHLSPNRLGTTSTQPSISSSKNLYRNFLQPSIAECLTKRAFGTASCGCPCPMPCGPYGNSQGCGCLPPPCNTSSPKCIQYMTGYYYYPYGVWFCGPYHVTGTCRAVNPAGPCCGPCSPCSCCAPCCVCPAGLDKQNLGLVPGVIPAKAPVPMPDPKRVACSNFNPLHTAVTMPGQSCEQRKQTPLPKFSSFFCKYSSTAETHADKTQKSMNNTVNKQGGHNYHHLSRYSRRFDYTPAYSPQRVRPGNSRYPSNARTFAADVFYRNNRRKQIASKQTRVHLRNPEIDLMAPIKQHTRSTASTPQSEMHSSVPAFKKEPPSWVMRACPQDTEIKTKPNLSDCPTRPEEEPTNLK